MRRARRLCTVEGDVLRPVEFMAGARDVKLDEPAQVAASIVKEVHVGWL